MKRLVLAVVAFGFLAGCANQPADPNLVASANRQVICGRGADCEEKWSRSVQWVLANSRWKIQLQTDQMLQTYGPGDSSPASAFVLAKVANGNGTYSITFSSACDNLIGCLPSALELRASFNDYVIGPVGAPVVAAPAPAPPKATLGVPFVDAPKNLAVSPKHKDGGGVMILAVVGGSVAEKAGIQAGDVVTAYDNAAISGKDDLLAVTAKTAPGRSVQVHLIQATKDLDVTAQF